MNAVEHIRWEVADFSKVHKNLGRTLDKLQLRGLHTVAALKIFLPRVFLDLILGKIWRFLLKPLCTQLKQIVTNTQRDRHLFCGQPDRNIACVAV